MVIKMDSGIETEDAARNLEIEQLSFPYEILASSKDAVLITGVALTEGVWKNVIYSAKELKKVASALRGKPLIVEHGRTREFGTREVGVIDSSYWEPTLRGIIFKARVTDALAKRLVKKGVLPAVSCSTWMEKRPINENIKVGSQYNFAELSLCRTPACDRCFIFHREQLSKYAEEKDLKVLETKGDNRGNKMPEIESLSELESQEELEELTEPSLFAVLELPDEESLASLRQNRNVVSFYSGHFAYQPYYPEENTEDVQGILAIVQCENREELDDLKNMYRVKRAYYGYHGYPYHYKYKEKKALGDRTPQSLSVQKEHFIEPGKPINPEDPKQTEQPQKESWSGPLMPHQIGAPNPEQCQKITCPVDDKEFEDEEKFMEHWNKEHKETYGPFKETMTMLAALSQIVELAKGNGKVVKMKNGRFMAMIDTGKPGFGQWKIVGNFATEKEARAAIKGGGKKKEEKQEEVPMLKCPACKEEFKDEKELAKHWKETHQEKYGPLKKGYKAEKMAYYYYKENGKYKPYYYKDGKYYKEYKEPKKKKTKGKTKK